MKLTRKFQHFCSKNQNLMLVLTTLVPFSMTIAIMYYFL